MAWITVPPPNWGLAAHDQQQRCYFVVPGKRCALKSSRTCCSCRLPCTETAQRFPSPLLVLCPGMHAGCVRFAEEQRSPSPNPSTAAITGAARLDLKASSAVCMNHTANGQARWSRTAREWLLIPASHPLLYPCPCSLASCLLGASTQQTCCSWSSRRGTQKAAPPHQQGLHQQRQQQLPSRRSLKCAG